MRYRTGDPVNDYDQSSWATTGGTDQSIKSVGPATNDIYVGSGFQPQSPVGVRLTDPHDDRVDYMAGEDGAPISTLQYSLPADVNGVGQDAVYGGLTFRGITYGANPVSDGNNVAVFHAASDSAAPMIQANVPGFWYDTLRKAAGFPLPAVADKVYGNATNDVIGDNVNDVRPLEVPVGERIVMEKAIGIPMRYSGHPVTNQVERPWDVLMGAWPWSGDKAASSQPVTAAPLFFGDPIKDGLPSPTGAAGSMVPNTPSLDPQPLTWRVQPSPWDDGTGDSYIDAGTRRSFR